MTSIAVSDPIRSVCEQVALLMDAQDRAVIFTDLNGRPAIEWELSSHLDAASECLHNRLTYLPATTHSGVVIVLLELIRRIERMRLNAGEGTTPQFDIDAEAALRCAQNAMSGIRSDDWAAGLVEASKLVFGPSSLPPHLAN